MSGDIPMATDIQNGLHEFWGSSKLIMKQNHQKPNTVLTALRSREFWLGN